MADTKTVANWSANMEDGISGPAADAAKALEELAQTMRQDVQELAAMKRALANLKQSTTPNIEEYLKLKVAINAKSEALASSQARFLQMGGSYRKAKGDASGFRNELLRMKQDIADFRAQSDKGRQSTEDLKNAFGRLGDGAMQAHGPLGRVVSSLKQMLAGMTGTKVLTIALGVAFAAAGVGAALLAAKLFRVGLAAADARRNELLQMEALSRMRNLWGLPPPKSKEMQDAIDRIAPSVSIARSEVVGLQAQLVQAGLRGKNLEMVLEAAAIKQSALGSAAGSAFAGFAASVHLAGGSAARAAQDIKNRFGGVVAAKMKSLEVQTLKQKEAFDSMLSGVKIEPFLDANKRLGDMLSSNTAAGRGLKNILTGVLQPLLDAATRGMVIMRRFFKQMLIGALEIKLAWLNVRIWYLKTFGPEAVKKADNFFLRMDTGRLVMYVLAASVASLSVWLGVVLVRATLAASNAMLTFALRSMGRFLFYAFRVNAALVPMIMRMGALAVQVALASWPFLLAAAAIFAVINTLRLLYELWQEIPWKDWGKAIIDGVVGGFKSGWGKVKQAVQELAGAMPKWFKSLLGIESPSKVFASLGVEIPRGVKQGVDKGAPEAKKAMEDVATPPAVTPPAVAAPAPRPAARGGGGSVTIQQLHVHAPSDAPKDFAQSVRRELEQVLAGLAIELGATR